MPTKRENIEKWSLGYLLLKLYVDFCFRFYFRTSVAKIGNIPKDKPLIFAPNHQNALMDALALSCVKKSWQPVFLARADIFEKPLYNKILTFLKILPVYRIRDGYENLHKNDETFKKTMDVLGNMNGLVILPEGNHGDKKTLRPLKKGIARIAFQTEEASKGNLNIHIVPVGIDYEDYVRVGSRLHIRFGSSIPVKPMLRMYKKNAARGYNFLLSQLKKGMSSEMVNIEEEKFYNAYKVILDSFTHEYLVKMKLKQKQVNQVDAQILIVEKLDYFKLKDFDSFLLLIADALEFNMLLNRRSLDPKIFPMSTKSKITLIPFSLLLLATLPIFILSFLNSIIVLSTVKFSTKNIKDKQFLSSFRFGLGVVLFPLVFILQAAIMALLLKNFWYALAYFAVSPITVILFFEWKRLAMLVLNRFNEIRFKLFKSSKIIRPIELFKSINNQMWKVVNLSKEETYDFS